MVTTRPAARHLWVKTVRAFKFARAYKNEMVHLLASEHIDGMYRKYLAECCSLDWVFFSTLNNKKSDDIC